MDMNEQEIKNKADEYFEKHSIWNGTIILNPINLMTGFANEISSLKTKELKDKLKEQMYNITTQSGEKLNIVEWEDIERIINNK